MAKILIVDDDEDLVESLKDVMEGKGHHVSTAYTGPEGVKKAKGEHPDLLILDVMMATDTEGFDIARKLREDDATKKLPVILFTGIKRAKSLPFSFEPDSDWLPVQAVLDKPTKPEDLLKKIDEVLAEK